MGAFPNIRAFTDAAHCHIAPKFLQKSVCKNFTQFRMSKDPISIASSGQGDGRGKNFSGASIIGLDAHKISNFTDNERIWKGLAY